ncbi:YfhD family protein [Bacillus sp. T3]|uniref:YfhD family protein n=1 Tax=Bacillus sp. T3 TaxID=467262 RepID=UPI002980ED4A|nr:YfhD family protein [Bacillus sp. T3]
MGRMHGRHKTRDSNSGSLPQTPKNMKSDGIDVEYSQELADQADLEAQARANAANQRVNTKRKKK